MRRRARLLVGLLALAATACPLGGGPGPSPTPAATSPLPEPASRGVRVAIVLPPAALVAPAVADQQDRAVAAVREALTGEVTEIRAVRVDGLAFLVDVAALLAAEGYDVVCTVGDTAVADAVAVADDFPGTEVCAVAGAPPADARPNLTVVEERTVDVGRVLGVAAATAGLSSAVVALGDTPQLGAWTTGLQEGVQAATPPPSPGPSPTATAPAPSPTLTIRVVEAGEAAAAAADLLAAGTRAIVSLAGPDDPAVADAVAGVDEAALLGDAATVGTGPSVLAAVQRDLGAELLAGIRARLADGDPPAAVAVGFVDDVITVVGGGHPRWPAVEAAVRAAVADLAGPGAP